jgi:hypothetical protein
VIAVYLNFRQERRGFHLWLLAVRPIGVTYNI